jgi:SAM-dependent methyltransferase
MPPAVADAYDAIAGVYDEQIYGDHWMRHVLWAHYRRCFRPGQHVLDVACGTGIDSLFLARQGIQVTAVDISPGMIAQLEVKRDRAAPAAPIHTQVLDLADASAWPAGPFDGVISAFAGLNTQPDLTRFACQAAACLRSGGRLLAHMLNRASLWERLALIVGGHWPEARHLAGRRQRAFIIGGHSVQHHLYTPLAAYDDYFAPYFHLRGAYGLGVLRPPVAMRHVPLPVARGLGWLERPLAQWRPFVNWGRFFLLDLSKL